MTIIKKDTSSFFKTSKSIIQTKKKNWNGLDYGVGLFNTPIYNNNSITGFNVGVKYNFCRFYEMGLEGNGSFLDEKSKKDYGFNIKYPCIGYLQYSFSNYIKVIENENFQLGAFYKISYLEVDLTSSDMDKFTGNRGTKVSANYYQMGIPGLFCSLGSKESGDWLTFQAGYMLYQGGTTHFASKADFIGPIFSLIIYFNPTKSSKNK